MNANQKKYIAKRIDEAVNDKVIAVGKEYGGSASYIDRYDRYNNNLTVCAPKLTEAEVGKAIKSAGGIKLKSVTEIKKDFAQTICDGYSIRHGQIKDVVANADKINEEVRKISDAKYDVIKDRCQKIIRKGEELKDEVYLGDEEKAMELLKKFRSEKF